MAPKFSIADIDARITSLQNTLSQFPRSHFKRVTCVHNLAKARFARYKLSRQKDDLDKCIVHYTEAIFLPPILDAKFNQPDGVKYSIDYLRYLRRPSCDSFRVSSNDVTTMIIWALAAQVKSGTGNGTRNIEEMVTLCRELLASDVSSDTLETAFISLNRVVNTEFHRGLSVEPLNEVVECIRDALKVLPLGSHDVWFALGDVLTTRFIETHSLGDYEEATAILERIVGPDHPGECPDSIRTRVQARLVTLAYARSEFFENPEYSELALARLRASQNSSAFDEELRIQNADILAVQAEQRFRHYGLSENLEEANSYISQVVDLSSSRSLEKSGEFFIESAAVREANPTTAIQQKILHLEELLSNTPLGTLDHKRRLAELADWYQTRFLRTNDVSDIEESIKYSRLLLDATHSSDLWRSNPLASLRNTLVLAFNHTQKISYLDESIKLGHDILKLKNAQHIHFHTIRNLVSSLMTRSRLLVRKEDLNEAIRLLPLAINNQYARAPDRFRLSCSWALLVRCIAHPSVLTAYDSAMVLLHRSLSFSPTLQIQHARLVAMGEDRHTMPLDYASYLIDLGRFEEAVETLEHGRALLWSEMRSLRTPIANFARDHSASPLEKRFAEINQELENLTMSIPPSGKLDTKDGVDQGGDGMDPFGRLVVAHQQLVEERDALISQIKGCPGSERLLKTVSFATLNSAASHGPVILINHSKWRSDILIINHNSLLCAIPTPDDFYDRANKLRDSLIGARKEGLDSAKYQHAIRVVLRDLYDLVGQPVIKKLRVLGVPEQSRIWWCPTSVFCYLPLHAMGPIPSEDMSRPSKPSKRYFSDLYIPSYTPSLSALIESRNPSAQALDQPSLLLVAQPDGSLPGVWGEIQVMQNLNVPVTTLISKSATSSSVIEGLRDHRFAHFACHGNLERGKPFDASFQLYGGERLTLLEIVRSRLPNAEFAFLSCCHAAEITEESIADEGLHLTAAMQYCGFRSVVGTMWAMADTDGRDLAENFYKSIFSGREQGVPHYERSARALRDAARKLRRKEGITLERWVNFVHYGA
ncbi:CHAT domain-containing protein [Lactarius hatsudake]|nr:CHAT domain-containing protein [Lactarius hatsudake]